MVIEVMKDNVYNIAEATCEKAQPRLLTKGEHKFLEIIETGYLARNAAYSLRLDRYSRDGKQTWSFVPELFDTFEFIREAVQFLIVDFLDHPGYTFRKNSREVWIWQL